jgi:hypothetical protein
MSNSYTSNRTNFGLKNWVILESNRIESYSEMPIKYNYGYSGGRLCSPLSWNCTKWVFWWMFHSNEGNKKCLVMVLLILILEFYFKNAIQNCYQKTWIGNYNQTYEKQLPLGPQNCGRYWQVLLTKR